MGAQNFLFVPQSREDGKNISLLGGDCFVMPVETRGALGVTD